MSDLFDSGPRPPRGGPRTRPAPSGRSRALLITAGVVVAGLIALAGFSSFWTERLWFDSVGYSDVFSTLVWTRIALFAVFGLLMAAAVTTSMWLAYRFRPVFRPASPEQTSLDRYREAVTPVRRWLLVVIGLLMGVFAGTSGAGQWRNFLLWRNGKSFEETDPYFGKDLGFYVFDLPWFHFVTDFVLAMLVVSAMGAVVVHYLFGGIRLQAATDKLSSAAQVQLSVLVGLLVLVKGLDYYLDRFDLLTGTGGYIDGMGYTDENAVLPAKNILMGIAVICAILFFLNVWRRTWMLPSVGLGLLVLSSILLGMIWPAIMERFQVLPSQADREAPYIEKHLAATKDAYGIDDVNIDDFDAETDLTNLSEDSRAQLASTVANSGGVRLVDPAVVPQTFQQLQQVRGYYTVSDVLDVDTYEIDGIERDVVLGVRELNQAGISEGSQNWANLHTVYTHGYGVIAAYGNQKRADNATIVPEAPAWAERDLPPVGDLTDISGEDGYEGRIYFGENSPSYSIVGKGSEGANDVELDLPRGNEGGTTTTYDGADGVEVGGLFHKLLYAVKFGEPNIVLSDRVNENSRILYDREPGRRVEKVAPWLTVDGDALPAVVDGKVVWIVDGYTTTDQFPLSNRESFDEMTDDALQNDNPFQTVPTDDINYIRNAVKATVDAYDGTVTLYAWDEDDPMLRSWMDSFPGTVQPRSEIPEGLLNHMRYPEDMFKVQRFQLASYHVDDAGDFYEGNDRWQVPVDPNNDRSLQPAYRLSVPSGDQVEPDTFSLTSVYTPANRQNLAAFVQVDGDASSDTYGEFRVRRLSSSSQVAGPGQIANQIQSDQGVTDALFPYRQGEVRPVFGNLLTLPVGESLLYVQPLYSIRTAGDGNYPVLRFVAVSFGDDNVGIGQTLAQALGDVLGVSLDDGPVAPPFDPDDPDAPEEPTEPTGTVEQRIATALSEADRLFAAADAALEEGDLGTYQDNIRDAQALIEDALELAAQLPGAGAAAEGEPSADATADPSAEATEQPAEPSAEPTE
ncbi:UPF0182 family protein [Nocardioides sp. ChNu-99]|uniref:UPF0182 family membrane protein n=1 Tax=Nocardioides sp. ChNu-99 TaxID=2839897 RepID=UPI002405A921|nr:UPF0182 family protein [Nocardioides sp. ChNu-99]MDF9716623.1 UPF0182 family protein [Nocardioides sp. ChNu-99]